MTRIAPETAQSLQGEIKAAQHALSEAEQAAGAARKRLAECVARLYDYRQRDIEHWDDMAAGLQDFVPVPPGDSSPCAGVSETAAACSLHSETAAAAPIKESGAAGGSGGPAEQPPIQLQPAASGAPDKPGLVCESNDPPAEGPEDYRAYHERLETMERLDNDEPTARAIEAAKTQRDRAERAAQIFDEAARALR